MKLGLAAIFKDEFDYILEWIAYHQLQGVDKFFIADNESTDGTSQLLEALEYLGIVKKIHFPRIKDQGPQVPAYNKILKEFGSDVDFLAFIDADEFIASSNGKTVKENLIPLFNNDKCSAVALNWRCFGSSDNVFQEPGLVIERFTKCSVKDFGSNKHIKTIVKPDRVKHIKIHECLLKAGMYYMSDGSKPVFAGNLQEAPLTDTLVTEPLVIHHYVVRSKYEHFIKKARKGSAGGSAKREKGCHYFNMHDKNDEVSTLLQSMSKEVKKQVNIIKETLVQKSPLFSTGMVHYQIEGNKLKGWVETSFKGEFWVRALFDDTEVVVKADMPRRDVYEAGRTSRLNNTFIMDVPKGFNTDLEIDLRLVGSACYSKRG